MVVSSCTQENKHNYKQILQDALGSNGSGGLQGKDSSSMLLLSEGRISFRNPSRLQIDSWHILGAGPLLPRLVAKCGGNDARSGVRDAADWRRASCHYPKL